MDLFSLKGKVIIVTGASGLLGREHIEAIASYGGIPVLIDLNREVIEALSTQALIFQNSFVSTKSLSRSLDVSPFCNSRLNEKVSLSLLSNLISIKMALYTDSGSVNLIFTGSILYHISFFIKDFHITGYPLPL
jgi:hypothetical protein